MSRGLGRNQWLFLRALHALEAKHGPGHYRVSAIVERAYAQAEHVQQRDRQAAAEREAENARLRAQADAGDKLAGQVLFLGETFRWALRPDRPGALGRKLERRTGRSMEAAVNPSRVLAGLARRGYVERWNSQGGGAAKLTEAGKAALASVEGEPS